MNVDPSRERQFDSELRAFAVEQLGIPADQASRELRTVLLKRLRKSGHEFVPSWERDPAPDDERESESPPSASASSEATRDTRQEDSKHTTRDKRTDVVRDRDKPTRDRPSSSSTSSKPHRDLSMVPLPCDSPTASSSSSRHSKSSDRRDSRDVDHHRSSAHGRDVDARTKLKRAESKAMIRVGPTGTQQMQLTRFASELLANTPQALQKPTEHKPIHDMDELVTDIDRRLKHFVHRRDQVAKRAKSLASMMKEGGLFSEQELADIRQPLQRDTLLLLHDRGQLTEDIQRFLSWKSKRDAKEAEMLREGLLDDETTRTLQEHREKRSSKATEYETMLTNLEYL